MINDRFLKACRREPVDVPPVWFMRQAGRYLAEYRALRAKHSLLDLCHDPALAAAVTLQPVEHPIRDAAAVRRLPTPDPAQSLGYVCEAARLVARALPPHVPLIGFAGAPFTLASYAIEGGSTRTFTLTKRFMYTEPEAWHALLGRLAEFVGCYLAAQAAAGARALQLFDSWVGCLSPQDYRTYVQPHTRRTLALAAQEAGGRGVPVIH